MDFKSAFKSDVTIVWLLSTSWIDAESLLSDNCSNSSKLSKDFTGEEVKGTPKIASN